VKMSRDKVCFLLGALDIWMSRERKDSR